MSDEILQAIYARKAKESHMEQTFQATFGFPLSRTTRKGENEYAGALGATYIFTEAGWVKTTLWKKMVRAVWPVFSLERKPTPFAAVAPVADAPQSPSHQEASRPAAEPPQETT